MSWQDRLRPAAYTSAVSRTRRLFDFENVSLRLPKKTSAFDFIDADGTYVQDRGVRGRRYPLRIFFWGENHDLEANAFLDELSEPGIGLLEHPFYGDLSVVPFGDIRRRDDLKDRANQTIFEVTFWASISDLYPTGNADPASSVLASLGEFNQAIATEFADNVDIDTASQRVTLRNQYAVLKNTAVSTLEAIADTQDDVREQFNTINQSINAGIDTLIGDPLTLAFQTVELIQAPARAAAAISDKLSAYNDLLQSLTGNTPTDENELRVLDLYGSNYVASTILSSVNTEFDTKPGALSAAEAILGLLDTYTAWREQNFNDLGIVDTGASYQQLQEAVAVGAGFLVEISFTLRQERSLVLTRNRSIIDLVGELYGSVDDQLDFFINSNDLSGSEIIEVPAGREIVYYV